jgi:hypothetical protein
MQCLYFSFLVCKVGNIVRDRLRGLRGLEVAFPPHDPSDAGSNRRRRIFKNGKIQGTKSFGMDFKPFDPCSRFTAR